jgi:hypothetical protein
MNTALHHRLAAGRPCGTGPQRTAGGQPLSNERWQNSGRPCIIAIGQRNAGDRRAWPRECRTGSPGEPTRIASEAMLDPSPTHRTGR